MFERAMGHLSLLGPAITLVACVSAGCGDDSSLPLDTGMGDTSTGDASVDADLDADLDADTDTSVDGGQDADIDTSFDAGVSCTHPLAGALFVPDTAAGRLSGGSTNASTTCTEDLGTGGPEHYYALTVAAETGVDIDVTADFDVAIAIRETCDDALSELACFRTDRLPGTPTSLRTILPAGTYVLVVDTVGAGVGGDYELDITAFSAPANGTCATAMPVTPDATIAAQNFDAAATSPGACSGIPGHTLYYEVVLPTATGLTVAQSSGGGTTNSIEVVDGCESLVCLAEGDALGLEYSNTTGAPQSVIVAVRGSGTFDLEFSSFPTSSNSSCESATTVADGTRLTMEQLAYGGAGSTTCFSTPTATTRSLYYTADVASGEVLRVVASPSAPADDLTVSVLDACAGATCLASAGMDPPPSGGGGTQSTDWANGTGATASVIIAVSSPTDATFDLDVLIGPAPTNDACGMAAPVGDGTRLTAEFVGGASDTLDALCLPTATAPVVYYSATIPAGNTLTALAAPNGAGEATLRVLDGCAATSCLASATGALTYTNVGASAESIILSVGLDPAGGAGATAASFSLDIDIGRPPYTKAVITGACDPDMMTSGTAVSGVGTDDSNSSPATLPFSFEFFGNAVTHYTVNSNGFVQLSTGAAGTTPNLTYTNDPIPTADTPNRFVAPFWDDLNPVRPGLTNGAVYRRTTGTAPNRKFVIEWREFGFFQDTDANLRFQAHFFETSHVIEFHYCGLAAGTSAGRPFGSSATVGLEDPAGTDGIEHSYNTAGSVSTADGLRFTPAP